jgi:hypothetical protein
LVQLHSKHLPAENIREAKLRARHQRAAPNHPGGIDSKRRAPAAVAVVSIYQNRKCARRAKETPAIRQHI